MKDTIGNIIEPMTHIINQSLSHGIIPQQMKTAKVIPIHKSADPSLLKNYMPVILLPRITIKYNYIYITNNQIWK